VIVFEHNTERDAYLAIRGKVVLNACPGSGKTTIVAYKLKERIKTWEVTHGRYTGIACLSFTNVAKDEINSKYSEFSGSAISYPHIVSTIDSFINRYITLPFYYLFQGGFQGRPKILDNPEFMNKWHFKFYQTVKKKGGGSFQRPVHIVYKPSSVDLNLDGTFTSNGRKPSLTGDDLVAFNGYCDALKKTQFSQGYLKNSDSTYVALRILREYPKVTKMLINRFPYLIIDEAQDTSGIQHAIIDELIKNGLGNIELVGDPYQSLFEWREACPDLFIQRYDSPLWHSLKLEMCRRSTQTIVNGFSNLRRECDHGLKSVNNVKDPENICVLRYTDNQRLLAEYKEISATYAERRVVVRGGTHLEAFGAKAKHELMWKIDPCIPYQLICAKYEMDNGSIKPGVRRVRRCLPMLVVPSLGMNEQKDWLEENGKNPEWNARIMELLAKLPSFELLLADWTTQTQRLCQNVLGTKNACDFELKKGKMLPLHKETISALYKAPKNSSFVSTIHAVKGMTFDSIMLVLSKNSSGQSISFNDCEKSNEFPREKKRMIYVAMSRPRYQLVIAVPQDAKITDAQIKEILSTGIEIRIVQP